MNRILAFSFVLFLVSMFRVQAQAFEGRFVVQIMDDGSIVRMRFMVKGDKIIIEPIDAALPRPIKMLLQKGNDKMYTLTEEQGMKIALLSTFKAPLSDTIKNKQYKVQETGNKKKIGIYDCRQVIVDNGDGQKLDMWVTADMGFTLAQLFENIGRLNAESYIDLTKHSKEELYQKNMALEINELKEGSSTQITIREIEKEKLTDDLFSIQGYTVMDMNSLMGE